MRLVSRVAPERIDIDAAASLVAGIHAQRLGLTALENVQEHALDAAFVEVVVLAVRNDVLQQAGAIDSGPAVAYLQAADIRLRRDRAEAP